jgi:ArsR family transcriptional regulator
MRLTGELFESVAERFRALGEPARLRILDALREGELTVNELVEATGLTQANLSKHLQLLYGLAFVKRRKEGLFVYYALADDNVFQLCDVMCGRIRQLRKAALAATRARTDKGVTNAN